MPGTDHRRRGGEYVGCTPVGARLEPACNTSERHPEASITNSPNRQAMAGGVKRRDPGPIDLTSNRLGTECFSGPLLSPVQRETGRTSFSEGRSCGLNSSMPQHHLLNLYDLPSSRDRLQYLHGRQLQPHCRTGSIASTPTEEDLHKYNTSINHFPPSGAASRAPSHPDHCYVGRTSFRGYI